MYLRADFAGRQGGPNIGALAKRAPALETIEVNQSFDTQNYLDYPQPTSRRSHPRRARCAELRPYFGCT
jgi:hypothetical protein